jgi:hypothetical protein
MHSNISDPESMNRLVNRLVASRRAMRPDQITAHYADLGVALKISVLEPLDTDSGRGHVLIEGDAQSLLFLADLLLAQCADELDCGFQIEAGSDSRFFAPGSDFGLYIHALPCAHSTVETSG